MLLSGELAGNPSQVRCAREVSVTTVARNAASARAGLREGPREAEKDLKKHEKMSDDPLGFLRGAFCLPARLQKTSEGGFP